MTFICNCMHIYYSTNAWWLKIRIYANNKMTSILAFLAVLLTAFGLIFIIWITIYERCCTGKQEEKMCRYKKVEQKRMSKAKMYLRNPKCPARWHRQPRYSALRRSKWMLKAIPSKNCHNNILFFENYFSIISVNVNIIDLILINW